MKFQNFKQYFSASRINRYLAATGNSQSKTIKLYKANLKISQSFHPLLGIVEVILRNRINDVLSSHFTDTEWIINQKSGFMSHSSLTYRDNKTGATKTNRFLKDEINKAERRLRNSRTVITSGKIISEQTFGFWTDLFEKHHYKILRGKPIQIFSKLPLRHGRKEVIKELTKVRKFRNRINHNEPICFNGNRIDFSETLDVYNSIIKILTWIDPEILKLISDIDRVLNVINKAAKI